MSNIKKAGPFAAFTNAVVAVITIYVAVVMIGLDTLTDQNAFAEIAINNPTPLIIQDALKLMSAACGAVLIVVLFKRLRHEALSRMRTAALFGFLSIILLLSNAFLSLMLTTQAAELAAAGSGPDNDLNSIIGILGMATLFFNGLWYLLVSWTALKASALSKGLNYLGLTIGALSLIPILGILALLLNVVWSWWLGRLLLKETLQ